MREWKLAALLVMCLVGICAGCVRRAAVTPAAIKDRGEIFLSMSGGQWRLNELSYSRGIRKPRPQRRGDAPQKFTVINLKNDYGRTFGKRVVPVFSGEILMRLFAQRLTALGYSVKVVRAVASSGYAVDISRVAADMEQHSAGYSLEAKCNLQATVEIWKDGTWIGGHDYQSSLADNAAADRDQLYMKVLERASEQIIADCIPAITTATADHISQ